MSRKYTLTRNGGGFFVYNSLDRSEKLKRANPLSIPSYKVSHYVVNDLYI